MLLPSPTDVIEESLGVPGFAYRSREGWSNGGSASILVKDCVKQRHLEVNALHIDPLMKCKN